MTRDLSRKEFFRELLGVGRRATSARTGAASRPPVLLRPPGALLPDERYLQACTGCVACLEVCPKDAIRLHPSPADPERQIAVLEVGRVPCVLCDAVPCAAVCPDGALIHPGSARQVRIGVAQVDPRLCRTFRGEGCDVCVRVCPYPGEAIRMIGHRPVVMPAACTGCGLCEAACPERPVAIMVHPERDLVPGMRIPKAWGPAG